MNDFIKQHGAFSWAELMTTDPEGAKSFYSQLFGWGTQEWPDGEMPYTLVSVGGREVGGMMPIPPEAEGMPPQWGVYVTVDDVDASAAQAETLGGKILFGPKDIPKVGRFAVIQDPQGATLSIITYVACD